MARNLWIQFLLVSIQPLFRRSQIDSVPFFKCEATKVERLKCQATLSSGAIIQIIGFMAVSSKDIEKLWKESSKSNSASDED